MTETAAPPKTAPTLADAIRQTFAVERHTPPFADRLLDLTRALIPAPWVAILHLQGEDVQIIAGQIPSDEVPAMRNAAQSGIASGAGGVVSAIGPGLVARVAAPGGPIMALAVGRPQGGQIAQSLAYERLCLLSALSFAQNAHPDQTTQTALFEQVQSVAADPGPEALQALADLLARHMSADYAAIGMYADGSIGMLKISGQDGAAKRASLPDRLTAEMLETARQRARSTTRLFAAAAGAEDGVVLHINAPRRNPSAALLAGAIYALSQRRNAPRRWTRARFVKLGATVLILIGVGLVPLPDRVEIPATVEASTRRVLTAPFTARLKTIKVADSQAVTPGIPLVKLDTEAVNLDLIEVRAERARALLDREAARAARAAAELRNAELEVERLDARIARLSRQVDDATLTAPIDGLVIAADLAEKLGTTVRQGDPLLEIADPRTLRLTLAIPDDRLGLIDVGLAGRFRPDYDPTLTFAATVTKISPAISIRAEAPVLDGRATLDSATDDLRPGLRGVFAPDSQWKPAGLLAFEAIRDWALLRLWF
ncbi:efflux RND transporter periplasmic adaptor subunit [Actibacterium sp. 188UL27-1]|uniref:efflux RND transporter periplasmic adaptor subunit n=1 Tax=Actibacterium sp. 188UL27-1 TaxID=2786961 RepID=UPI00195810FB|nr:HlyD family secretion protein [Actibacterium sp. 188UL27-1]MBM7070301.1 HlyD family efflux transporter periplasmic adaptor subunit [Actibacterium sp. 188UL27-1]